MCQIAHLVQSTGFHSLNNDMIESVQWYQTREYNFGILVFFSVCISLELQVRTGSNLETRYRIPSTITIIPKFNASAVHNNRNGGWFWGHTGTRSVFTNVTKSWVFHYVQKWVWSPIIYWSQGPKCRYVMQ